MTSGIWGEQVLIITTCTMVCSYFIVDCFTFLKQLNESLKVMLESVCYFISWLLLNNILYFFVY